MSSSPLWRGGSARDDATFFNKRYLFSILIGLTIGLGYLISAWKTYDPGILYLAIIIPFLIALGDKYEN